MKIEKYTYPHSSFLSVEKDTGIIINYLLKNENLKKLLYYTTPDCLTKPKLTEKQTFEMFGKNIRIIPKITVDSEVLNYIVIGFDGFKTNFTNPEFRDNVIEIDIICHLDQWNLGDYKLRPYRIAAELDTMLNNQHLTGIGELKFGAASQIILNDEFAGLCLLYQAIHGEEDKKIVDVNPNDEELLIENFNNIFND